jgi:hypothetical protein|tara:strand:+ start:985 stop:1830 length:846 start_codon:yes stop_codon:yes gene_type:complete
VILIDYNAVAIGSVILQKDEMNEDLFRHLILNNVRMYRNKFKDKYGEIVVCGDGRKNWRKEYFPNYKFKRGVNRKKDNTDWKELFRITSKVYDEIGEHFPYKTVLIDECEADDVIGTLVDASQEFGKNEPIMIVSSDKDFAQLQKYNNVKQYSPLKKTFVVENNPRQQLLELILKGDTSDGVPNVLSNDNCFVEGIRQTPMRQTTIDTLVEDIKAMGDEVYRNYCRNKKLIDLEETPSLVKSKILNSFDEQDNIVNNRSKVFPYLVENRCRMLLEDIEDFI